METALPAREFPSTDVCRLARMTLRQLQWWDERGIVSPQQLGRRRMFLTSDVLVMMVIAELRRKGVSLQKIRRLVRHIRREIEHRLPELFTGGTELLLVTDGRSTHFEDQAARVIDLLKRSRKPLLLLSVSEQAARVTEFERTEQRGRSARRRGQLDLF
jgi:DNA-binding transcriptional MerR regulator